MDKIVVNCSATSIHQSIYVHTGLQRPGSSNLKNSLTHRAHHLNSQRLDASTCKQLFSTGYTRLGSQGSASCNFSFLPSSSLFCVDHRITVHMVSTELKKLRNTTPTILVCYGLPLKKATTVYRLLDRLKHSNECKERKRKSKLNRPF